ncbi:MAG: hypothetical protein HZB75_01045 [Candidatus Saccharibacteria bacterium]|nr:MAG: hypothetical protein HZB75_01045 [Candidatus Saccharibacteria bacterium]
MNTSTKLINNIVVHHQLFADLAQEADQCYKNESYTAALACLFVLAESSLKYKIEADSQDKLGLYAAIEQARGDRYITDSEAKQLHTLRQLRNELFHNDSYAGTLVVGELSYPLYEHASKQLIYEMNWKFVFKLVLKLV